MIAHPNQVSLQAGKGRYRESHAHESARSFHE